MERKRITFTRKETDTMSEEKKEFVKHEAPRPEFPKRAIITGGMPYGNKKLHFGHIGGVFVFATMQGTWYFYILALAAGAIAGMLMLAILKKPLNKAAKVKK